jgi:S-adenosylmethionine synthetase
MAKSVVKSGLCKRALVQLSYAIGVAKPLSLFVETYGSEQGNLSAQAVTDIVKINFDARPGALARDLALRQPKYNVTAAYCHFGRDPYTEGDLKYFAWEDAKDLSKYTKMSAAQIDKELASQKEEVLKKWVD